MTKPKMSEARAREIWSSAACDFVNIDRKDRDCPIDRPVGG
jgi:hypothetical protein